MSVYVIRKMTEEDWQDYRDIRLESLEKEPIAFVTRYEEANWWDESVWKARVVRPSIFGVRYEEKIIGMVWYFRWISFEYRHNIAIWWMYLAKKYRWTWVAQQLFDVLLEHIKHEKDVKKYSLVIVLEQEDAYHFYIKNGFEVVGKLKEHLYRHNRYYDEVMMEFYL